MSDAVLPESALSETFLAATGPGGQNVNKVATAVQLRLDVYALRLAPAPFQRLKALAGSRWTQDGGIIIMARGYRTREANRADARARLQALIDAAHIAPIRRIKTKPPRALAEKRLTAKATRGAVKQGRGRVRHDD